MTDKKYIAGEHPDLPPPSNTIGAIAWIRENLLSSPANIIMTILSIWFLYVTVPPMLDWLFIDAAFTGNNREECKAQAGGACWAFIDERLELFTYGFYPIEERWRVNLSFVLLVLALIPVLWDNCPMRKAGMYFSCVFPFIAGWLLLGGFGLEPVPTDKFGGFMLTLVIGVTGIAFSLPIGICLALGRQSKLQGTTFDLLLRVLIMVTLFASAYMAEVVRGGLQAIPKGQIEAADAMGLKYWSSMRLVVLPQALKISIPGIVNTFIGLYKDTTLVIIIGLLDPLGIGRASLADTKWTGLSNEVYLFVAIFFFVSCFSMARYSLYLENKLQTDHKR